LNIAAGGQPNNSRMEHSDSIFPQGLKSCSHKKKMWWSTWLL